MATGKLKLEKAVDKFVKEMKSKLRSKMRCGYSGWDDGYNKKMLEEKIKHNLLNKDYVDVANLAMMLWNLDKKHS